MEENRFDWCYEDFLNSHACDVGHDAIFELTKDAFAAGWRAAGTPSRSISRAVF